MASTPAPAWSDGRGKHVLRSRVRRRSEEWGGGSEGSEGGATVGAVTLQVKDMWQAGRGEAITHVFDDVEAFDSRS